MVEEEEQFRSMTRVVGEECRNDKWDVMIMLSECPQSWTKNKDMRNGYIKILTEGAGRCFHAFN